MVPEVQFAEMPPQFLADHGQIAFVVVQGNTSLDVFQGCASYNLNMQFAWVLPKLKCLLYWYIVTLVKLL